MASLGELTVPMNGQLYLDLDACLQTLTVRPSSGQNLKRAFLHTEEYLGTKAASTKALLAVSVLERNNLHLARCTYYLINYGFEVYGDRCLGDDPSGKEHGPTVVDLLQKKIFPELYGDPMIDSIIKKCWHGEYKTIGELAENTSRLCGPDNRASDAMSSDDLATKRELCEELVGQGVLEALGSNDPRQRSRQIERRWVSWEFLNA
ncbi:hypothetical protein VC83_07133 [Pseudogymnoascus destructans]|uniref:Uncharacterized protein n=1 Tax=Pseudogymnoascus destructans TaxID=655981 RepID=A0A177A304_9PEZI|nr:uncharacterized protein VC83_07133 [Pseudogymnoascus destructans]OAF56669.1 hypothetical protein VC83_07133 [Pseudogymnoascus destructans]